MATRVNVGPGEGGERLPWLEAVEDADEAEGPGAAKLIGAILVGLLAIGAIVGGFFWMGNRDGARTAGGQPELILAEPGPYKVRPPEPGGMQVEGRGDAAFAASEGADPQARIDVNATPEAPVAVAQATPAPQPAQAEIAVPVRTAPPAAQPATGGASVQLGAFSSNAAAEAAWKSLSERFAALASLGHNVQGATVNGRSVYRLRASVGTRAEARELCGRLAVAGESCVLL